MIKEQIFNRKDHSIMIHIGLTVSGRVYWSVSVYKRGKGCRKWVNVFDANDYVYRGLDMESREKYRNDAILKFVTGDDIRSVQKEILEDVAKQAGWV